MYLIDLAFCSRPVEPYSFLSIKHRFCYTFGTLVGKNYRYNLEWCLKFYFRIVNFFRIGVDIHTHIYI